VAAVVLALGLWAPLLTPVSGAADEPMATTASAGAQEDPRKGRLLFFRHCRSCHSTTGVDATAPDLRPRDLDRSARRDLAAPGAELYENNCRACHGNRAQGVASYPRLSDKSPQYIAERLKTYRAGERIGPNSVLMIQNARGLTDAEIASLAVYVTSAFD